MKAELIKMGNDLNLLWLNPFSTSKPQTFEAKILVRVQATPLLSLRGGEIACDTSVRL